MDKFAALRAFVAVVERGAFARAARDVGQAPSSLTRQVDALEDQLGAPLLNRSTRRLSLTDAGEIYYEQALRILEELAEADRSVGDRAGPLRGVLRASLPVAFAQLHIAPLIPGFLKCHPAVELEISLSDAPVDLVEDRMDLAIRIGPVAAPSVIVRKIAENVRRLCASPDYIASAGAPASPEELAGHACLGFLHGTKDRAWHFAQGGTRKAVPVTGPLRANSSLLLREAAIAGTGIALLPDWLIDRDLASGALTRLLPGWDVAPRRTSGAIHAVYLPSRRASRPVRSFVDYLAAGLRLDA
ncbi:LysR family transcriptional regulator [Sphingomonas faeni]|uniref:LysR family transcriptional regulator n=1 Tax=Sphingomonas faeni TaxID=185950 RepID=UPI00278216E5|nr:LysR family transcriptional regulator [Sphingomonas faeni]MDQ0839355.1 DNA-binding transcriptional LysR family regulator [Sphingomonas faeni]